MPFLGPAIAMWIALGVGVMAWYYVSAYRNSGPVQERREPAVPPPWREPVSREPWSRVLSPDPLPGDRFTEPWSDDPPPPPPIAPLPLWRQASWLAATRPVVMPPEPASPTYQPALPAYDMEDFPADSWGTA